MGFGLEIGFIEHLQIIDTSNYSSVANWDTLQFTPTHTKSYNSAVFSPVIAWWQLPMADVPLTLGSRTVPLSQLPDCNSNSSQGLNSSSSLTHSMTTNELTPLHSLNSSWSVEWYSLEAEPTENTVSLLAWVAWYDVFHCSGTIRLMPDRVATLLPAAFLLLYEITEDVTCSSVACAVIVRLISCLLCRNLVTALTMLQYILVDVVIFPITDLLYNYLSHLIKIYKIYQSQANPNDRVTLWNQKSSKSVATTAVFYIFTTSYNKDCDC
jgi:hypothetical protein